MDIEINKLKVEETLLLEESSKEVKEIYNMKAIFRKSKISSGKYYRDEFGFYKKVIEYIVSYIKESNMNLLEALGFLSYVAHSGILSYDNCPFEFDDDIQYETELIGYSGAQVLTGSGCCRHLSNFFRDVLRLSDFDVKYILNDVYEVEGLPYNFSSQIYGYHLYMNEFCDEDNEYVQGKHACLLFKYGKNYLVYDPTNLTVLYVDDLKAISLGGIGTMKINLSPSSLVLYEDFTYPEMIEFIKGVRSSEKFSFDFETEVISLINRGIEKGKKASENFIVELNEMVNSYREYRLARLDGSIHLKYIND